MQRQFAYPLLALALLILGLYVLRDVLLPFVAGAALAYLLDPVADRLFRGEKGRARLEWAERAVDRHGGVLVVMGRFIPGGRTASTFAVPPRPVRRP